jgi:O-acetyl-ADP-ribose deacetylase (regulator of RNase III)
VTIEVIQGDITKEKVDAIVNAANQGLSGGGGVDGAIHQAAGSAQLRAACQRLGGCQTGEAVATPGFNLPAQWIIHAVGPRWRGGGHGEADLLASCYRRSLVVAADLGARSIAFPAISTGIYGYPAAAAAAIAVSTIQSTLASTPLPIELVRLVAFDHDTLTLYRGLLGADA